MLTRLSPPAFRWVSADSAHAARGCRNATASVRHRHDLPNIGALDRRRASHSITANIAPGAILGHVFQFSAAGNHIHLRDSGGGPPSAVYTVGSAINPTVVDYVIITADGAAPSTSTTAAGGGNDTVQAVPFEHAWLLGLLVLGYGTYAILRTRR